MKRRTTADDVSPDSGSAGPSPEAIVELGGAFWGSKTLLSAVGLGLFSELAASGPLTAEALRDRLGLDDRGARDFFDALVALKMLERDERGYRNTAETDTFLDRAKPTYVGGMLEMFDARLYGFWGSLTDGLRTGRPQNEAKTGGNLFEAIYPDPERLRGLLRSMTGFSAGVAQAIVTAFPWERYQTVIDVGCAEGVVPTQIALHHPHISGGGFELPPVEPHFNAFVARAGVGDRMTFHGGDFFTDELPSADVLIMGHILHDWALAEKRTLLAKAHAALPPDGALIVYDAVIDDDRRRSAYGLLSSLNMLIETPGGFDYTGADCQGWLRDAGFGDTYVQHLAGPVSMVVGFR